MSDAREEDAHGGFPAPGLHTAGRHPASGTEVLPASR